MNIIDPFRLISNFVKETKKYIDNGRPQVTPKQYEDKNLNDQLQNKTLLGLNSYLK